MRSKARLQKAENKLKEASVGRPTWKQFITGAWTPDPVEWQRCIDTLGEALTENTGEKISADELQALIRGPR